MVVYNKQIDLFKALPPDSAEIIFVGDSHISSFAIDAYFKDKTIKIICPYISNQFSFEDFSDFQEDIKKYELIEIFNGYFKQVIFLNEDLFSDGTHLKTRTYLPENYLNL